MLPALAPLARDPPARDLLRRRRIGDVDDLVDVARVSGHAGREVDVAAAVVVVAVRSSAAGLEPAEERGRLGIADVPDQDAFVERTSGFFSPAGSDLLQPGDHAPTGDLYLDGPRVGRAVDEADQPWRASVGDVDDGPPAMPEVA